MRMGSAESLKNKEIYSTFNGLPTPGKTGPILKQSNSDAKMLATRSASARTMEDGTPRTESGLKIAMRTRMAERTASRKSLVGDALLNHKGKIESDMNARSVE